MERGGYIYIVTNKNRTALYVGVTSNLFNRIFEHQTHKYPSSHTAKYNLEICIYYEYFPSIEEAISREKRIKKWRKQKKIDLINTKNPHWDDLGNEIEQL